MVTLREYTLITGKQRWNRRTGKPELDLLSSEIPALGFAKEELETRYARGRAAITARYASRSLMTVGR